ncbi:MAG: hypothetical protein HY538_04385 [Deltaproteobacteria bacterium]|nr:hypothetical protein [Deltaproteobacteria bacterium]
MDRFKNFTGLLAVVGIILTGCGGDEETRSTGEGAPSEALEISSVGSCYAVVGESTSLSLQGSGFQGGATVLFGQENGEEFGIADESAISIEAVTASSSETIDLTVTCHVEGSFAIAVQNPDGTSDSIDGVFQCSSEAIDCSAEPTPADPASMVNLLGDLLDQLAQGVVGNFTPNILAYSPETATAGEAVSVWGSRLEGFEVQVVGPCGDPQAVTRYEPLLSNILAKFDMPDFDACGETGDTFPVAVQFLNQGVVVELEGKAVGNSITLNYYIPEPEPAPTVEITEYSPTSGTSGDTVTLKTNQGLKDLSITVFLEGRAEFPVERTENSLWSNIMATFTMPSFDEYGNSLDTLDVRIKFKSAEGESVSLVYNGGTVGSLGFAYIVPLNPADVFVATDIIDVLGKVLHPEEPEIPDVEEVIQTVVDILKDKAPIEEEEEGITPVLIIPDFEGVVRATDEEETLSPEDLLEKLRRVERIFGPSAEEIFRKVVDILNKLSPEEEKPIVPVLIVPDLDQAMNQLDLVEINSADILESLDIGDLLNEVFDEDPISPVLVIDVKGAVSLLRTAPTE